jgi:hypothetical protein
MKPKLHSSLIVCTPKINSKNCIETLLSCVTLTTGHYTVTIFVSITTNLFIGAHHQKSVIVDQDIAFVGGLDLCYGRWDSPDHNITDTCQLRTQWPGKDYSNESIKVTTGIDRPFDGNKACYL